MTNWCDLNQITINCQKTKFMVFGGKHMIKRVESPLIYVKDEPIQKVKQFKYLGITLDEKLTFRPHVHESIRKASHRLYQLCKIRRYINTSSAVSIYKSMILPYMEYGDVFMSGANQVDLDKLQRLQNRGLRICLQSETRTTLYDLHKHSKLQRLEHRRVAHLRNLIFKKTLKAPELQAVLRRSTRAHDGPLLVVAQPKNELFKKSVHYKGGILWNELDGEIRNIKDLNTFKRKTKNWLVIQWWIQHLSE